MLALVVAHPLVAAFAAYWLFSALVTGMPEPSPASSIAYTWFFHSLNIVAGYVEPLIRLFIRARFPGAPLPEVDPPANPSTGRLLQMPPPSLDSPKKSA